MELNERADQLAGQATSIYDRITLSKNDVHRIIKSKHMEEDQKAFEDVRAISRMKKRNLEEGWVASRGVTTGGTRGGRVPPLLV